LEPVRISRELELDDVTLTYPDQEEPALAGLSTRIARGEWVGVVGPTGAGKTTLVDILLGLLIPDQGIIRVDGRPLDMREEARSWRAGVGYVPQSIFLSDDSIALNIAFGVAQEEVDRERVHEVAALAQLDEFIRRLPDGYDTLVGERGVRISGGQRQRIGVARALYRDPSLLLFDEATSALDGPTERGLMQAVYGLGEERTLVIVAHRLQTVKRCDRILLLQDGRLADEGEFEALMERNELFRVMARGVEL
jgi:ABC-type multidrug transport system fused ATPase/permease subunit